jgi:LacI family transcriptional regulator
MARPKNHPHRPTRRVLLYLNPGTGWQRRCISGVIRYATERGGWSLLYDPWPMLPSEVLNVFQGADGILTRFDGADGASFMKLVREAGIPLVSPDIHDPAIPGVRADNLAVGAMAFQHLHALGLKNFTFWALPGMWFASDREAGFAAPVRGKRLRYVPAPTFKARGSQADPEQLRQWVLSLPKPIGVFACNVDMARQTASACREAGVQVPDEVAIIGCDEDEIVSNLSTPPVTTIDHGMERIGYECAKLLDRLMDGEPAPQRPMLVQPVGVVRRLSTDVLAIEDADLREAVRYIREHACQHLTVAQLVRRLAVGRRRLEIAFRDTLGRTIHDEIIRIRIERAKELLTRSKLSLPEIASRAGFSHICRMNEAFQRVEKTSPSRYRKTYA